jgi:hypothetical protein
MHDDLLGASLMASRIDELLGEIRRPEEELEDALKTHEVRFRYQIEGTRVKFQESVQAAHRRLRVGVFHWIKQSEPRNLVTAPVIYAMIVPFAIIDLTVSFYQLVCFPLYRIPKVERKRFIAIDRHQLSYLNSIEKLNCIYCGYINGVIAYIREIVARTEQYWCPIKHARKILDPHRRYVRFADFGDSDERELHLKNMRAEIREESTTRLTPERK